MPAPKNYGFDIAFKSNVTPFVTPAGNNNPISMAFGYSDNTPGTSSILEKGEKTRLKVAPTSKVSFQLYDLDTPKSSRVNAVSIRFRNRDAQAAQQCPFSGWTNNTMTFYDPTNPRNPSGPPIVPITPPQPSGIIGSAGCNITAAAGYGLGGVPSTEYTATNLGDFFFTVTVTLADGTVFQIDPEMDVSPPDED